MIAYMMIGLITFSASVLSILLGDILKLKETEDDAEFRAFFSRSKVESKSSHAIFLALLLSWTLIVCVFFWPILIAYSIYEVVKK